jgi:hypothetical protein
MSLAEVGQLEGKNESSTGSTEHVWVFSMAFSLEPLICGEQGSAVSDTGDVSKIQKQFSSLSSK